VDRLLAVTAANRPGLLGINVIRQLEERAAAAAATTLAGRLTALQHAAPAAESSAHAAIR
jgi:hypothetical protein